MGVGLRESGWVYGYGSGDWGYFAVGCACGCAGAGEGGGGICGGHCCVIEWGRWIDYGRQIKGEVRGGGGH